MKNRIFVALSLLAAGTFACGRPPANLPPGTSAHALGNSQSNAAGSGTGSGGFRMVAMEARVAATAAHRAGTDRRAG